jgi:hypothetical protein
MFRMSAVIAVRNKAIIKIELIPQIFSDTRLKETILSDRQKH